MRFLKACFKDTRGLGFCETVSDYRRVTAFQGLYMSILALVGVGYGVRSETTAGRHVLVIIVVSILSFLG
jgi:hypothetical protein